MYLTMLSMTTPGEMESRIRWRLTDSVLPRHS